MAELTNDQKERLRHVQLNLWEVKFLQYMKEHSGEVEFDFSAVEPRVQNAIWTLSDKKLIDVAIATTFNPKRKLKLRDEGRSVLEAIDRVTVGRKDL